MYKYSVERLITLTCRVCRWHYIVVCALDIIVQDTEIKVPLVNYPFSTLNSLWIPSRLVSNLL